MKTILRHRPQPATIIACIALAVALGGTSYAAINLPANSVGPKQLKKNAVTRVKIKNGAVTGAKVANNTIRGADILESSLDKVPSTVNADNAAHATAADNATNATNSSNLGGSPAGDYQRFGSTLPPGRSESGDYGIRTPNTSTSGYLDLSVSFPTPLATRIPAAKIIYTGPTGTTHCNGPGNAERGYLCIYQINATSVSTPPDVSAFENQFPQNESGNFGFNMEWAVTGAAAFSIGTWTVTAP